MRILAPAALIVFGLAFLLVIVTSGGDSRPASSGSKAADKTRDLGAPKKTKTTPAQTTPAASQASYVVKTGDTLGSIAEKTGVPVTRLQELNPQLDPQALVSGQKIRLRE
jgi:LysM repeat protein